MDRQVLLQLLGVIVTGGLVPLTIFLMRRKTDLKALDRTSSATYLSAASELIEQLQEDCKTLRHEVAANRAEIVAMREDQSRKRAQLVDSLQRANEENYRLEGMVAQLHTDLAIAKRQIIQLQASLG